MLCLYWLSQNSYLIHLRNSGTRHVHANKMRHFVARVHGCSVIDKRDGMFGNALSPIPVVSSCWLPSQRIEDDHIAHLQPDQRQQLQQLLDEFAVQFDDRPGRCNSVMHGIQATDGFVPRQMRPYRVPDAFKPEVDRQIQDLLVKGLIRPSNSPMASPIVCVAKKNGGVCIACDYRYFNSFTVDDAYPMPTIDEVLRSIGKEQFISTFDARSGYWEIPLAEEHRWLTAFVTHNGLYEWLRMPFGLKNAGATFVCAVRSILRPIHDFADSYVDDIGVGSQDWETRLYYIRRFLSIVIEAGMTLNLAKCEFGKPEVKFVGRMVRSENHRPDPHCLQGLAKIEVPRTKKELRALLEAFGYYREYIPHFSAIAMLLTDLTKKGVPNVILSRWSGDCQQAYDRLKAKLSSTQVLRIPTIGTPFQMHTEASGKAVKATIEQLDEQGVERPLAFASQKLSNTQMGGPLSSGKPTQ